VFGVVPAFVRLRRDKRGPPHPAFCVQPAKCQKISRADDTFRILKQKIVQAAGTKYPFFASRLLPGTIQTNCVHVDMMAVSEELGLYIA
jgi:hypothetical protein